MSGPLSFAVSLDNLAMLVPACLGVLSAAYLLWNRHPWHEIGRRMVWIGAALAGVSLCRFVLSVSLFLTLADFVGYETEELPYGPFVRPGTQVATYAPFLIALLPLMNRWLRAPADSAASEPRGSVLPRRMWLPAWAALVLLLGALAWPAEGRLKQGRVLISTFHTQWSPTSRPYDREWYGADSGYNYACLKRWFECFYPVGELTERIREEDLEGASLLVVYVPDQPFTEDEVRIIEAFVRRGGGLLLIGDHTNVFGSTSHLNALGRSFGLLFRDDVLFDQDEDFFQLFNVPSPGSAFLHGIRFFKFRGPTSIRPIGLDVRPVINLAHAKSMRAIYSVNNFYPPPHDHPQMASGLFCVSAAVRHGQGRVVAFGDSTVFSNFEIFYPGKYEYLLNVADWLNHSDRLFMAFLRRLAWLTAFLGSLWALARLREPRSVLTGVTAVLLAWIAAQVLTRAIEVCRAGFPQPTRPSPMVFFLAADDDPAYQLTSFTSDAPYDQRYDVFIQWVLRTGAFSAFQLVDEPLDVGLHGLWRNLAPADCASALIVRRPDELALLNRLAPVPGRSNDHLLLLFSRHLDWAKVEQALRSSDVLSDELALDQARAAWPEGSARVRVDGRTILLVFSAERFSDQAMGISEKVVPNETQRALFDEAFALIDQLFNRDPSP